MKKNVLFISIFGLFYSCTQKQEFSQYRTVELEIIGDKMYDEMYIRSSQLGGNRIEILGETVDGSKWTFTIPDSIVKQTTFFEFKSPSTDSSYVNLLGKAPLSSSVGFLGVVQKDTLIGRYFHFENDETEIRLKAEYHHTKHEYNNQYIPTLEKTVTLQEWDADYFIVDPNQNRFLRENMVTPLNFFFESFTPDKYENYLTEFAFKIKETPNSLYYIGNLVSTQNYFESKKDVEQLYYLFSDEIQCSYLGQVAYRYFSTFTIDNVSLPNCDTKTEEKIVTDTNKYTLLIFSASWCVPCHKKIPMLKKIHEEMSEELDMAYITTDDEKTLPNWEKLMQKENIPWRSLSIDNNKELKADWNITAIPDYILICPNLEAQKIRLYDENDIIGLYSIIQNK